MESSGDAADVPAGFKPEPHYFNFSAAKTALNGKLDTDPVAEVHRAIASCAVSP